MDTRLTDDCEDAGGFSGSGVALVLGLVVKDRLMDDEDPLDALGDYLIFLTFPDLTAVPEPFNLKEQRMEGSIEEEGNVTNADKTNSLWHLGSLTRHFTFKLGRFLLFHLHILQGLRKLHMRSWKITQDMTST